MRIVFFGTSSFAAQLLSLLLAHQLPPIAVVTRPDRPQGRQLLVGSSPVKELVQGLPSPPPLLQPARVSTPAFEEELRRLSPDLFLVIAFGEILKKQILAIPPHGCLNVHASLLPAYRGAAPMQRALMDGVSETGITLMEMDEGMDTGPILVQRALDVPLEMTLGDLQEQLATLAGPALLDLLHAIKEGRTPPKIEQEGALATLAPKITPQETRIRWDLPALHVHHLVRALSPSPGAWCPLRIGDAVKRLKIKRSLPLLEAHAPPGTLLSTEGELIVACREGALRILELQLEGKRALPVAEFLKGLRGELSFPLEERNV
jgi:methionyl-tRNA formyltransferase